MKFYLLVRTSIKSNNVNCHIVCIKYTHYLHNALHTQHTREKTNKTLLIKHLSIHSILLIPEQISFPKRFQI